MEVRKNRMSHKIPQPSPIGADGRTPASKGGEIRAASAVNVVGRIEGAWDGLWEVADGAEISVRPASELDA